MLQLHQKYIKGLWRHQLLSLNMSKYRSNCEPKTSMCRRSRCNSTYAKLCGSTCPLPYPTRQHANNPRSNRSILLGLSKAPDPDKLKVAATSAAIRSTYALVDNSQQWECTIDSGCQVVAMSENTCHDLGLMYDPSIKLNMEFANGEINKSLELTFNVPFQIEPIIIYLQVHVIQSPAYNILLGCPFDILMESVIRNFTNEDQTINICDPNSGQWVTIPTLSRLCPPHATTFTKDRIFRKGHHWEL